MATLFLVDGSNHAFRVHFALPPMHAADGFPTRTLYGFTTLLAKMVRVHKPDHVVVSFDTGRTFRHELYQEYKGHRPDMPEDLRPQWPLLPGLVEAFGYRCVTADGFEADDVLATLALRFADEGFEVKLVTGDKDYGQLVDDRIHILDLMREEELGPAEIKEKTGVLPSQVVDQLALAGDTTDNIPGIPGIGMRTAAQYLEKWGTLDAVLEAAKSGKIAGKRGQSLVDGAGAARLSRQLVTLRTDVPLPSITSASDLAPRPMDEDLLRDLFDRWDFGKVARSLLPRKVLVDVEVVRPILTIEALAQAIEGIRAAGRVAFGFEVDHPDPLTARPVGVRLAWSPLDAVYVPLRHEDQPFDGDVAWAMLRPVFEDAGIALVGHDVKADWNVGANVGLEPRAIASDTLLVDYVLYAHERTHGLEAMAQRFLGHSVRPYLPMEAGRRMNIAGLAPDRAARYAGEEALLAFVLADRLERRLADGPRSVYQDIELPLVPVLSRMERAGIRLDLDRLAVVSADVDARVADAERYCHEVAGKVFNVSSRHELRDILFEELKLPPSKKVSDGWSTDQSVLEELEGLHPLPGALIAHRSLAKLKSTYLDKLPGWVRADGRIHSSFNQAVAATGRLSSQDPNLQNIPIRTEEGRRIRDCFVPDPGWRFVSADYSQIELRVLAHYTEEPMLLDAFARGHDIHRQTAAEVFGVSPDEVTSGLRSAAKAINFGLLYGMSAFRLGRELTLPRDVAQRYMDEYFARLPAVSAWIERSKAQARTLGFVETLFGRRRVIPDIHAQRFQDRAAAEREAVNTRVQGTAADLVKLAMIEVDRRLLAGGFRSRMLVQVHDELLVEAPEGEVARVSALIRDTMERVASLKVPLSVNVAVGVTWNEAHG